ncbi:hypothetical protein EC957_007024 [Mortierella hygrophila]|uniref:Uncharacterized protein n=1 Tax=Mortierella hygrophila TaxID=979708 RepID=A0A9P6FDA6_9FUNG|nr:hypothetical protein EC957_007024 [Mortierella hygrophila]
MDVDDTFDEQYNPVISAYQSSHDLFKHFQAAVAPPTLAAVRGQQQNQQQQQQQQPSRSLPPPSRRRYPVPTFTSRLHYGEQLLSPTSPTKDTTSNTTNISSDRNPGAGADIEVDPAEKEASIAQWAQEQAAIQEHRLEKQRRSKVRAQAKDELRNILGLAENSIDDTSIRPLNLTLKPHGKLLDADSDDDNDDKDSTTTTHYKTPTFGLSDIHQSSTPLKVLLEKDNDDDDEPQMTAK